MEINHGINSRGIPDKCPKCGDSPIQTEVRNYDMAMHDGDVCCSNCGYYIRMYDAG
jgi:hypothetical protein